MEDHAKEPLTQNSIDTWRDLSSQVASWKNKITDRIEYILNRCFEEFDATLETWYFEGADEGEVGDLKAHMWDKAIWSIVFEGVRGGPHEMLILLDGHEWDLYTTLPVKWLCEDFEDELVAGKEAYEKKEAQKKVAAKAKRAAKKSEKEAAIKSAKKKLTAKE